MNQPSGKANWLIRAAGPGDESDITELHRTVHRRVVPGGYWKWKLHSLPTSVENEWVAESEGRIIGHYAVTPIRFKFHDRLVLVPHGCDAMTHPEYRRRGILTALAQRANTMWKRAGSPFQIGFHYGGWGSVRELLGWQPVSRLVWMKRWIRPFTSMAGRIHLPGHPIWRGADKVLRRLLDRRDKKAQRAPDTGPLQMERVMQADARFDRLWMKIGPGYRTLAIRDRPWVQWRCLDRPGADQRLYLAVRAQEPSGYIAMRITQSEEAARATILDYLYAPDDADTAQALLQYAIAVAAETGARSLAALVAPGSAQADQIRAAGFHAGRHGYDFSAISYDPSAPPSSATHWFLTGAEGDVL